MYASDCFARFCLFWVAEGEAVRIVCVRTLHSTTEGGDAKSSIVVYNNNTRGVVVAITLPMSSLRCISAELSANKQLTVEVLIHI